MEDFRWLSPEEQRCWRTFLAATQGLFGHLERDTQQRSGLSQADYEVLVRLSEAPDRRLRMSALADETLYSRSRLSHAVKRLTQLGWLIREECPTDRRGAFAVLADKGFAALAEAAPGHVDSVRRLVFDQLSAAEVAALGRMCTKISTAVAAAREQGAVEDSCEA